MIEKIVIRLQKLGRWLGYWLWQKPISKPVPEKPVRLKATEVFNEYVVINYHGQRINLHRNEIPLWQRMSRKDKRAMAQKFTRLEKEKKVVFTRINGREICIKNKDYGAKTDV